MLASGVSIKDSGFILLVDRLNPSVLEGVVLAILSLAGILDEAEIVFAARWPNDRVPDVLVVHVARDT